jgi:tellurite resistance protein
MFAHVLLGYGLLQALVLLRLLFWFRAQPFGSSLWAFSFGVAALAAAALGFVERGETGAVAELAPVLFVAANAVIGGIAVGSVGLLIARLVSSRRLRRAASLG